MENNNNISNKKDSDHKRDHLLKIYLTEGEKATIKKMAKMVGISCSAFGRAILMDSEYKKELLDILKVRYEVNKIGANLNQMAKVANQSGQVPKAKLIKNMHRNILTQLNRI
ncbi:mobilisation protein (MobC) [Fodinibius roseus]|uniref:Mobilisation protein (MobC) n=1 Tax=Fodinibius roseus TaxID=1194090 RepID=A0A1M5MAA5_9BACT|nr:plasmid mobilization relaxosome protein MobC [Fodinibius roseus]SHG74141.1 mobilisation protein (MobC) [Fodinibius roseus]